MIDTAFSITTDTSTLSIFDLASLKHRLDDTPDWWSIPKDAITEINKGNVIFLNLEKDGDYDIEVCDALGTHCSSLFINVPSGFVFVGSGEDTTGGGLEPDDSEYISGKILNIPIGEYEVRFYKQDKNIKIMFLKGLISHNNIDELIRI